MNSSDAVTVTLTVRQAKEISGKFGIMAEEPDLLESYGLTEDQVNSIVDRIDSAKVHKQCMVILMSTDEAYAALGEMENVMEIAEDAARTEPCSDTKNWMNTARDGVRRIQSAIDSSR